MTLGEFWLWGLSGLGLLLLAIVIIAFGAAWVKAIKEPNPVRKDLRNWKQPGHHTWPDQEYRS